MSAPAYPTPPITPESIPKKQKGKGLGIAALVLGIVALVFSWIPFVGLFGVILGIVGLILGAVGFFVSHRWMSLAGFVIGVVAVIVGFASTNAGVAAVNNSLNGTNTSTQSSSGTIPAGKAGTDGALKFTITNVSTAHSLGNDPLKTTAQGKYVIVNVTVINVGSKSSTFNAGPSQVAADTGGKQYQTSADAITSASSADSSSFLQAINPGNSVHGRLVYDVPPNVTLKTVTLHGGLLTSGVTMALY
ncbi:MAG: DUF4352 domain-containing protein [Sciscionella sp.]